MDIIAKNPLMAGIAILVFVILIVLLVARKGGNRSKTFNAALLSIKVITHDTKIYTFDLPEG